MNKRDFFYKPSLIEDWLTEYKDALEIDLKSVQPYVSLWLNDKDLPDEAAKWFKIVHAVALSYPWAFCEPPERVEDLSPKDFWFDLLEPAIGKASWRALGSRPASDGKMRELQGQLDDYRKRLKEACATQARDWMLISGYRMAEYPDYLGYVQTTQSVWALADNATQYTQPEHRVTLTRNLQEIVHGMEVNKAISTVARARALQHTELTLPDLKTCSITYEVDETEDDRAWAEAWYRDCLANSWPLVPEPFLGPRTTQVAVRDRHIKTGGLTEFDDGTRDYQEPTSVHIRYREEQDVEWDGRLYQFGPWKITGIERDGGWDDPTQADLDLIETGLVIGDIDDWDKEDLWPIWRDNQLMEGIKGFEKKREMRPGEEQELRAQFEQHWNRIKSGNDAKRARRQSKIDERRAELQEMTDAARRLTDQKRNLRALK